MVGGFGAKEMQGPSRMDLPAFYPDLILWQKYGGYLDMDETLRSWRTHFTGANPPPLAEIRVFRPPLGR